MHKIYQENLKEFSSLLKVIEALRDPISGCPWDLEQSNESLAKYAIEEAYEYVDAVNSKDKDMMADELGDLLLQVVLNSKVAEQSELFNIETVIESINKKMIRRHPHVFGDLNVSNSTEVLENWENIKAGERDKKIKSKEGVFADIPKAMPSLLRSAKIGKRSRKVNFDWNNPKEVWDKVKEEVAELEEEVLSENLDKKKLTHELGDLLFSLSQLARHLSIDPEEALTKCNERFEKRFYLAQELASIDKNTWEDLKDAELNSYWEKAKKTLKHQE